MDRRSLVKGAAVPDEARDDVHDAAASLPKLTDRDAIRLMHEAIDRGITDMDNSWDYNGGVSEQRMGRALVQNGYRTRCS